MYNLAGSFLLMTDDDDGQEYVVEDVDGEMTDSDWCPPPLASEHIQQLKTLGLL